MALQRMMAKFSTRRYRAGIEDPEQCTDTVIFVPPGRPSPQSRTCRRLAALSDGVTFSSCLSTLYISLDYHRKPSRTKKVKSLWMVARDDECHTFCSAEMGPWKDRHGNLWAVAEDAQIVLGTRGERIAFFDAPVNEPDPWHGFPVSGRRGMPSRRRPPDQVVRQWLAAGWISFTTHERIIGSRI